MAGRKLTRCFTAAIAGVMIHAGAPAGAATPDTGCRTAREGAIPARPGKARRGSAFAREVMDISGRQRDEAVMAQLLDGNIPAFLRHLRPVTLSGKDGAGHRIDVTICVTPDYLAVGDDADFVRVPMGLPAASAVADSFGFLLPTPRMVDAIHAEAAVQLAPSPMPPTRAMSSTDYFWRHNQTVRAERAATGLPLGDLTAGQKKDIVLTNRLRSAPGRVAIYGWHRLNGRPIQPLSTVHGASYADYSHGVRLVGPTAFVDGVPERLADILQDPHLARIVSGEGPISHPLRLQASLHQSWPATDLAAATVDRITR